MMYKLFKYIIPFLALFSLFIFLNGNDNLFNNFTMNFLTNLSNTDIRNPSEQFNNLMEEFNTLSVLIKINEISGGNFFTNFFTVLIHLDDIIVSLVKCLVYAFYDILYNLIQILKLIFNTTGVGMLD